MDYKNHERLNDQSDIKSASDRSFGLVFSSVFLLISVWPLFWGGDVRIWCLGIALGFFVITLLRPQFLSPINKVWAAFGELLHKLVNPIIMGFLFYIIVTPTSLLMRLMGKRPLDLRFEHERKSYWIESTPPREPSAKSMRDQF